MRILLLASAYNSLTQRMHADPSKTGLLSTAPRQQ